MTKPSFPNSAPNLAGAQGPPPARPIPAANALCPRDIRATGLSDHNNAVTKGQNTFLHKAVAHMPQSIHAICVFCGARNGTRATYVDAAQALGQLLAAENWRLVYGAGDVGLMGEVARAAQSAGADTFGVIPRHLLALEQGKRDLGQLVVTETMHERKTVMFANSDAIVVLPGGAGSLDEFFEVLTWRQLGLHSKPIFLLNVDGYWSPLVGLIDHIVAEGFAPDSLRGYVSVVPDVAALGGALRAALP